MFMFPNAYVDLATIGSAASMTGGQIFRYSYFKVGILDLMFLIVVILNNVYYNYNIIVFVRILLLF